jgi:hypothetical protein
VAAVVFLVVGVPMVVVVGVPVGEAVPMVVVLRATEAPMVAVVVSLGGEDEAGKDSNF